MKYESILDCIHQTPLVLLPRMSERVSRRIYAKLEGANPGGSMKDRIPLFAINEAEKRGDLKADSYIVESTSENLGVGLAMAGRQKGYRVVCVVDPKITPANLTMLQALGAEVIMVKEADQHGNYLNTRIARVEEILAKDSRAWRLSQCSNSDTVQTYYETLGPEILRDLDGNIDWLVAPVGTGGLLGGLSRYFKDFSPKTKVMAVDACGSIVLRGPAGPRRQVGIGANRPSEYIDFSLLDFLAYVDDSTAFQTAAEIALEDSLFLGCSSGSAFGGLLSHISVTKPGDTIVVVAPDGGLKYVDTIYNETWLDDCAHIKTAA